MLELGGLPGPGEVTEQSLGLEKGLSREILPFAEIPTSTGDEEEVRTQTKIN